MLTMEYKESLSRLGLLDWSGRSEGLRFAQRALRQFSDVRVGRSAPSVEGRSVRGAPMRISGLRGNVVLVDFWASWCGACLKKVPPLRDLDRALSGKPFVIVGVNNDRELDAAKKAIERSGITWSSFWDGPPSDGPIAQAFGVQAWPTTFLLDKRGVIRAINPDTDSLASQVKALLEEETLLADRSGPGD